LAALSLVLIELVVCERLHGQAGREHSNSQHLNIRVVSHHDSSLVSERCSEGQRDDHLHERFGEEDLEQSGVPEVFLILGFGISWVVFSSLEGAVGDAVEETSAPERNTGQDQALVPGETIEGLGHS
jgi:hypothetical protein